MTSGLVDLQNHDGYRGDATVGEFGINSIQFESGSGFYLFTSGSGFLLRIRFSGCGFYHGRPDSGSGSGFLVRTGFRNLSIFESGSVSGFYQACPGPGPCSIRKSRRGPELA